MTDKIATPVPAATIVLLRDGAQGLETFMVVRHHEIDFASGALVFPGGKADAQDADPRVLARLAPYPGATAEQSRLRAAAIREAFEESGILLARHRDGRPVAAGEPLERWRAGLNARTLTLADVLEDGDLQLATDDLAHFAHWITPAAQPKRFDTHFYLARVPGDQVAAHDGTENVDSTWIRPQQAIADARAGSRTVIFPTLSNLVRLAQHARVAQAFDDAARTPIRPIQPWRENRADGTWVCIERDAGYTHTEQKVPVRRA
jgi:8-oxo-dGTP pyrophosphatase MutT (NUDIX family)